MCMYALNSMILLRGEEGGGGRRRGRRGGGEEGIMVKILLKSTHAPMYTRTNTHVRTRTNTPQQIYCWQLRVQYHRMNTLSMQILPLHVYRTYAYIRTYTLTWYTRSVRGVDSGDSRQVGTASRPLFCFGFSTVHYIDKENDISFFIFQYVETR